MEPKQTPKLVTVITQEPEVDVAQFMRDVKKTHCYGYNHLYRVETEGDQPEEHFRHQDAETAYTEYRARIISGEERTALFVEYHTIERDESKKEECLLGPTTTAVLEEEPYIHMQAALQCRIEVSGSKEAIQAASDRLLHIMHRLEQYLSDELHDRFADDGIDYTLQDKTIDIDLKPQNLAAKLLDL